MTNFSSRFFFFPLLIMAIVLHFAVFGDSPHNPYGIKGLNELYLAICIIFTILLLLASAENAPREFRIIMYYCAYTTVVFLVLPAIFAYYTYGQPIVFGLIEERRVLAALGFAPLLFLGKRVSTLQFERAFLYAALIAAFFSLSLIHI